ncbi:hypothetical protein OG429_22300 [Streptomyces sp. NBC_00190]|uniref:hypothetical protein n=1 Tax=unclassified Streptomyces TaxID=2593676 RepID=UPI002E2D2638|nr:hypothetical protein [Streptomyces sp. NBC_00190]WSZ41772.1 hypothetical protein OG239_25070 [Streptomyces sp. NBC_00868]
MNKIYGVAASAAAGAVTGWMARALWLWAMEEDRRSCADSGSLCLTYYPLVGIGLWVFLSVPVLLLVLRVLNVRPLKATVPAALALQFFIIQVLAGLSRRELPGSTALTVGAMAAGPALVALCTDPARRRYGIGGIGVLGVTGLALTANPGTFYL